MKLLAAIFAGITILAVLPGFAMNVTPILCLFGKVAAVAALVGFAITAIACLTDERMPHLEFEVHDGQA